MKAEAGIVATVQAQGKNWKSPHVRCIVLSSVGWWRCFFCEFLGKLGKEDSNLNRSTLQQANMAAENYHVSIGDSSSNGCFQLSSQFSGV